MKLRITHSTAVVTVFTGIFLAGYWLLILPQFRQLGELFAASEQGIAPHSVQQMSNQEREEYTQKAGELEKEVELLLPKTDNQYDLSIQLEAAAQASSVTLTTLSMTGAASTIPKTTAGQASAAAAAATGLQKLTVSMAATGSYEQIQNWLVAITSINRFTQVDQVNVAVGKDGEMTAEVSAFAYYMPN